MLDENNNNKLSKSLNLTIVDCKYRVRGLSDEIVNRLNLTIVDCKSASLFDIDPALVVLISP